MLSGFQAWQQEQFIRQCLERRTVGQDAPDCALNEGVVYAQPGSLLRYSVLTTLSSATVFFSGQFQNAARMWQNVGQTVIGTSAGGIDRVTVPATQGCYKNMVASVGSAVVAGSEVYVIAELGRTNNGEFLPYAVLVSGYVRTNEPIDSGGGSQIQNPPSSGGGGGCCIGTTHVDTASGVESISYTITVPSGAMSRILRVSDVLVAAGAGGARTVYFEAHPSSGLGYESAAGVTQGAGATYGYVWQAGGQRYNDTANSQFFDALPMELWFSEDILITLSQVNVQTGDNWLTADITWEQRGP